MSEGPAIRLEGIRHGFGERDVLRGATLDVPRGRLTVLLGPNGSGKTTLLRIAAGLVRPRGGRALVDGVPAELARREGRIGYIPQQLGLVRSASALDNAAMGALGEAGPIRRALGFTPSDARDRALAALDLVGLREKADAPVRAMSGGERQRVAIARTLVQDPDVIVADELIASLDVVQAHAVMELQRHLRKKGATLLVSLHQIDVALGNADLVAFLHDGLVGDPRAPEGLSIEEARASLAA